MAQDGKYGKIDIAGIPEDEPVFVFRAQDVLAIQALCKYAELLYMHKNADMGSAVHERIVEFIAWPKKKLPD